MSMFDRIVEQKIQQAIENGEFADNPLAGKPLELKDDSAVPEELRLGFKILKDAGVLPEKLALREDIRNLSALLEACTDDAEVQKLRGSLAGARLKYDLLLERRGVAVPTEYRAKILRKLGERA